MRKAAEPRDDVAVLLRVAELLVLMEKKYGRVIDARDVGADNFDTPEQMFRFVEKE